MSGRMHTWPVPFVRSLDGKFDVGQTVFIKGFVLGDKFDINITNGPETNSADLAFHLSCRPQEGKFVANNRKGGEWGKEERHSLNFKDNEEFDIRIRAENDKFEVFSQGKSVFTFDYRVPITQCTHVYVDGTTELHHVSWEGRFYEMPYHQTVDNLRAGKKLYVSGVVHAKADRFNVNLKSGPDFALHLNPRFDEKVVVRNYMKGGNWGQEERDGDFNLKKDRTFDIIINITDDAFEIYLDGQPYCTFPQHIPVRQVDELTIEGDVELQGVHFA